jgi:murein DD-endopeptidase MepM/ murein hydrolase activator NlpD
MVQPTPRGLDIRTAQRRALRAQARRSRRIAALLLVTLVVVIVLVLTAFGSGASRLETPAFPQAERLLPAGAPAPQVVAMQNSLPLLLPINQSRITAIGYAGAGTGALALQPVGRQANAGLFERLFHRVFGGGSDQLPYYLMDGGSGPATSGLDVGAPVGTDVYSPVDGTVIAISDQTLNGRKYGVRLGIQPSGNPGVVVTLSDIDPDPALTVGSTVSAARTKVGRVIDLSSVERSALASFTQDKGQHVHIDVRTTGTLAGP